MKILVTGGAGLIGHNVVARLTEMGHDVVIIDNHNRYGCISVEEMAYLSTARTAKINNCLQYSIDICNHSLTDYAIARESPDVVIHLASYPRQKAVNANPVQASDTMSAGLVSVLESCVRSSVKRVVYASSSMVYGDFDHFVSEDAACNPIGQYGILKLAGEWLVRDYTRRYGLEHVILRPSAVYGPLDVGDRVIGRFLLAALQDKELTVNGANETLDFTYVTDAADGFVAAALESSAANNTYNITKSHSWTLLEAAELAVKLANKGSIRVLDRDADFPSRGALCIDAAKRDLGFAPKVDLEEGFGAYLEWLTTSPFWGPQIK